jgi:hypothetical protein
MEQIQLIKVKPKQLSSLDQESATESELHSAKVKNFQIDNYLNNP